MRRTSHGGSLRAGRGTSLSLLLATGFWASHSITGCGVERVMVGALAGEGGELGNNGEGGTGDDFGDDGTGGTLVGGRSGNGNVAGRTGGGRSGLAGNGSGGSGGIPGNAGVGANGGALPEGGFAGTFAGYSGDGSLGGAFGNAGSVNSAGSGATGGTFGNAGSGGTFGNAGEAGAFGYAGDSAVGSEVFDLTPPEQAPCAKDVCTGTFEWREATLSNGDYVFSDFSSDSRVIAGYGAGSRGYRLSWSGNRLWMLLSNEGGFETTAASASGSMLIGSNKWVVGNAVPSTISGVPAGFEAVAMSNDGAVIAMTDHSSASYVVRGGDAERIDGIVLAAVSEDGLEVGGQRVSDERAVTISASGDVTEVSDADGWKPSMVRGFSGGAVEGFQIAFGDAVSDDDDSVTQPFRWSAGGELELLGLPEGAISASAQDADGGSQIVGITSELESGDPTAFVSYWLTGAIGLREYVFWRSGVVVPAGFRIDTIRISSVGHHLAGGGQLDGTPIVFHAYFWTQPPDTAP